MLNHLDNYRSAGSLCWDNMIVWCPTSRFRQTAGERLFRQLPDATNEMDIRAARLFPYKTSVSFMVPCAGFGDSERGWVEKSSNQGKGLVRHYRCPAVGRAMICRRFGKPVSGVP